MATLGKIRSKGPLLVIIVGGALLAFIAQAAFEGMNASRRSANVGEIYGDEISALDYQSMVEEYTNIVEFTTQETNLSEEQTIRLRDQVWQTYVNNKIVEHEAELLGLTVSDAELQSILTEGTHMLLRQTPFVNEKTGLFDKDALQKFLAEYEKIDRTQIPAEYLEQYDKLYSYWMYIERTLRQNCLAEKYQQLIAGCLLSNKLELEANFNERSNTANFQIAAIPYTTLPDSVVNVTDADLKNLYEQRKSEFRQYVETRTIRYISVPVKASEEDRAALEKEMKEAEAALAKGEGEYKNIVMDAESEIYYYDLYKTKDAFPKDVQDRLENISVGQTMPVYYNSLDNTFNTFKYLASAMQADSVKFRQIPISRTTLEEAQKVADSIYTALQGGAKFEDMVKKYGGIEEGQWISSANYENAAMLDATTEQLFATIFTMNNGEVRNLEIPGGQLIVQVEEKKSPVQKYKIALVKRTVNFSKDTYSKAYNKFSAFLNANSTVEDLIANAEKNGYLLQERNNLYSEEYNIGRIQGSHEALRWAFQAKKGEISPLYECGTQNSNLLVIAVVDINKEGYLPFEKVKESLRPEAIREKKAEKIIANVQKENPSTISACQNLKGATIDSLLHVSFSMPAYVSVTRSSEPALSAYAQTAQQGKLTAPIKGNGGVYFLSLGNTEKSPEKYNETSERQRVQNMQMQSISRFMQDLILQSKVKDTRYLYF